jgi:ribosomal protein L11 methyltransferase
MILPDTLLHIYEVRGDLNDGIPSPPRSFVGLWNEDEFSYLFFTRREDEYVMSAICSEQTVLSSRHEIRYQDWQSDVPEEGIHAGGIHFVRSDLPMPPPGSIRLDPSVVFGDGNHPTTLACLDAMADLFRGHKVQTVLDLGTGSGILALAAAALGAVSVVAVDKNRLAVQTARENVTRNSLASIIRVEEGEARVFIDTPYDLVSANLPFRVLRDLVITRYAGLHSMWIVSGINEPQATVLKELLVDQGYVLGHSVVTRPWETFVVLKTESACT